MYNLLKKIIHPIILISQPLTLLNYSYMVKMHTKKKELKIISLVKKSSVFVILTSTVYFGAILLLKDTIDNFFDISLDEFFIILSFIFTSSLLQSLVWWGRSISNIFNPKISLIINLLSLVYGLAITNFVTKYYGLDGMVLAVCILNLFIVFYWTYFLLKYCKVGVYEKSS